MTKNEEFLLKTAPLFDVHKWSDYPEVNAAVNDIFNEIKSLRTRIRGEDKVKRAIKVIILDLWAAYKLSSNPYRGISKNKNDFTKETRYNKIFLKYDYFSRAVNDLVKLGYIHQALGFYNEENPSLSKRTRIKALPKLIDKILNPTYGINELISQKGYIALNQYNPELTKETIILRDKDEKGKKHNIPYEDTHAIKLMRSNLNILNQKLHKTRIALHITGEKYEEMLKILASKKNPNPAVDFTRTSMHRVFNNGTFEQGGRFYGGWWQSIPKDYRKYITIDYKPTIELDYSGHHLRMLYAIENLTPPDDPYDIPKFARNDQKTACLIMINAADLEDSIGAIHGEGISKAELLIEAIKTRHSAISKYFFSEEGNKLMNKDSMIAERLMLRMLERGATVLPLHDSFIVRNSYADELEEIMKEEFEKAFKGIAKLTPKKTVLDEVSEKREDEEDAITMDFDLDEFLEETHWEYTIWGY
jgi:hypothetical protein